jgi:hypothetical protein
VQSNPIPHSANNSNKALHEVFGEQVKDRGLCSHLTYSLMTCVHMEQCKYKLMSTFHILQNELYENIRYEMSNIPIQQLQHVPGNMFL